MKIGINASYWQAGPPKDMAQILVAADRAGVDSFWTAEAYGSDALTPLAWWGGATSNIRLGTAVMQMSARTPTAAAMAAISMDHLTGGRFIMGLGVSGPQVVEGWYGQPYGRPLARTREYIDIVRQVFARNAPVTYDGQFFKLPLPTQEGNPLISGLGRPLRSTVHPLRSNLPIHLAAEGPKNIALAAEIADGWLPAFYSPRQDQEFRELLAQGFSRRSPELSTERDFEVSASVLVAHGQTVKEAADQVRPVIALYVGGMGAKEANFHRNAIDRLGYAEVCDEVQAKYLAGDKAGAMAAIPLELIDDIALVGPVDRMAQRLQLWQDTAVTSIIAQGDSTAVRALIAANAQVQA